MVDLLVKVLINAVAVYAAVLVVPQIHFGNDVLKLLVVALILALINSYIKPILKVLSFPITLVTFGLFALVLNAVLLLVVAWVASQLNLGFRIAEFPPKLTADAFVGALFGSIVISIVSTFLGLVNRGRGLVI